MINNNKCVEINNNILKKGIIEKNLLIYYKDNFVYIELDDIRCFKLSMKRLRNTFNINSDDTIINILIKYIKNISIIKKNDNLFYFMINYPKESDSTFKYEYKIKLKELNDFSNIKKNDDIKTIVAKQNKKILILLNKINEYNKKYKELDTDDEIFIIH